VPKIEHPEYRFRPSARCAKRPETGSRIRCKYGVYRADSGLAGGLTGKLFRGII
jgi:hypothetical protein